MIKETAIEWLYNKMYEHRGLITIEEFEQAKQMHKEEIVNGYANGHNDGCRYMDNLKQDFEHGEQYYQETYGGNNE